MRATAFILIDPRDSEHLFLATDRAGVLESRNGGAKFVAANHGYSEHKVETLLVERQHAEHIWAGVVNDKSFGGVFYSADGGYHWSQRNAGLEDRDILSMTETADGQIVVGTNSGIFLWDEKASTWQPRNLIANTLLKPSTTVDHGRKLTAMKPVKEAERHLESRVRALDASTPVWIASTGVGLLTSKDKGTSWQGGPVLGSVEYLSIATHGKTFVAARPDGVIYSLDSGQSWWPLTIPSMLTRLETVAFSDDGTLWIGAREGVYLTRNFPNAEPRSWMWIERMPFRDADVITWDAELNRLLVATHSTGLIYLVDPKSFQWTLSQTGFPIKMVRRSGDHFVAASLEDGVLVEGRDPVVPGAAR